MKFRFWGVRGSIPAPGPNTAKYGGNTTCIEIRTAANDLLILDAGTGIHALAQALKNQKPLTAHILITHTHWDHIQGLPFFLPLFEPDNQVCLYGGLDPVTQQGIERALTVQLQYSYFPISEAQLRANLQYLTLKPNQRVTVGGATVTPVVLNHPVLNFGYRVEDSDGTSLFFTGDYEIPLNTFQFGDPEYEPTQQFIDDRMEEVLSGMREVDALIVDSSYTDVEYEKRLGWGHGTYRSALALAAQARVKRLFFTHHEPTRGDDELEAIYQAALKEAGNIEFDAFLAREGDEYDLSAG
ncbi:MAG: MBL fold metallo-hydrolase [Gammaproteobacteria bacterium]